MPNPFRIAFLGIDHPHGAGWRELLANLSEEIEITAIMPGYEGNTRSLEERHAQVPRFSTIEELIEEGQFEAAIVCLPNDAAPAAVSQLARAGKHVLVEKPIAGSAEAARAMAEAVRSSGVAFQSGYLWRYNPAANRLRDMIRNGRFGKLTSVEMTFVTSDVARRGPEHYLFDPKQSGGGFFNWLACHFLDLFLYVSGQSVVGVTARCGCFGSMAVEVEDGGVAILELSGGGVATFVGGYWLPRWAGESHWTVRGSSRWVHWFPSRPGSGGVLEIHGPQPQWHAMEETFTLPPDKTAGYGGAQGIALLQEWIAAARNGLPCRNTVDSALATLELIDLIYQSSQQGRRIACEIRA